MTLIPTQVTFRGIPQRQTRVQPAMHDAFNVVRRRLQDAVVK
jgi:hypothetical protein